MQHGQDLGKPEYPVTGSDFSGIEGTNCYCSPESADIIRKTIAGMPLHAIHTIGTGDYHYITLFWTERIEEPFALILYDNHPDDQETAFGGDILSCGSWVRSVRSLPMCKGVRWTDGGGTDHGVCIPEGIPVYISIDLDILSEDYARTDWDQGTVSLEDLSERIKMDIKAHRLIGADICGGLTVQKGASAVDLAINAGTTEALIELF